MADLTQEVEKCLRKFDAQTTPLSEGEILDAVKSLLSDVKDTDKEENFVAFAETMAFGFCENYLDERTGWGTYFGPMWVFRNEQGQFSESPSIRLITERLLAYWGERAEETGNPVMQSRYADLVWDFTRPVLQKGPAVQMAQRAVDSYVQVAIRGLYAYESQAITKLARALSIALSIGDSNRVGLVRDVIIDLEARIATDDKPGLWGFSFDLLVQNPKVPLSPEQKRKLIDDLEARLIRTSSHDSGEGRLIAAELVTMRLAPYYRKIGRLDDAYRVLRIYGKVALDALKYQAPLVGLTWIQKVHRIYHEYGMRTDADALSPHLEKLSKQTDESMQPVHQEVNLPSEEVEDFLNAVAQGTLEQVLVRIANEFVPDFNDASDQVRESARNAPLQALIRHSISDHEGRPVAEIGSVEDDFDGRVVLQLSRNMVFATPFLRMAIEKVRETLCPTAEEIVEILYQSPVFPADRKGIILEGLSEYLRGNLPSSIHILVPQIEHVLRCLLRLTGGPLYRPARNGGLSLRMLSDILRDGGVVKSLGEPRIRYLKTLLDDPRGWNIRNDVCHGLADPSTFGTVMADRLFHVLLVLARVRQIADSTHEQPAPKAS